MKLLILYSCLSSLVIGLLSPIIHANEYSEPYAPIDRQLLQSIQHLLPTQDWQVIALVKGQLNNDGHDDYALVMEKTLKSSTSPARHLLVLLSDEDEFNLGAYRLIISSHYKHFIPPANTERGDPLAHIAIREGLLELRFQRRSASHFGSDNKNISVTYNFKRQPGHFALNHWQYYSVNPRSGLFSEQIINLEKGQQETTSGSMSSPKHQKSHTPFKTNKTWCPGDIKDVFEFRPER